ncbi:hypothetical protein Pla111_34710 [Botrimarina hoheduenensis]|uniref:Uncharacterized protein n=1 Tax=Botrimarina hoheduenensis TaxID=2528000 RepID=A0A5C5VPT4_9BACT|nr:hypothetical protein Pla111_34710 [Botrimarina hoheduenensis]
MGGSVLHLTRFVEADPVMMAAPGLVALALPGSVYDLSLADRVYVAHRWGDELVRCERARDAAGMLGAAWRMIGRSRGREIPAHVIRGRLSNVVCTVDIYTLAPLGITLPNNSIYMLGEYLLTNPPTRDWKRIVDSALG